MGRWAQTKQATYRVYVACPKCKGVDTTADRALEHSPTMTCLKCHHVFVLSSADVDPRVRDAVETIRYLTRMLNEFTEKEERLELHREEMYARQWKRDNDKRIRKRSAE